MSYQTNKVMTLEDGQELLKVLDEHDKALDAKKAPVIEESNTTPASVMTLSDAADGMPMGVECEIAPVQDLNGYANPWPAGGGKNLLNPDGAESVSTSTTDTRNGITIETAGTYTISVHKARTSTTSTSLYAKIYDGSAYGNADQIMLSNATFTLSLTVPQGGKLIVFGGSGVSASLFKDTVLESEVQVESGSTATSYAPYSNVCPITGHSGCGIIKAGVNFIDDSLTTNTNEVLLTPGTWYAKAFLVSGYANSQTNTRLQYKDGSSWASITAAGEFGTFSCTGDAFGWMYANHSMTITVNSPTMFRFDTSSMDGKRRLAISNENMQSFVAYKAYAVHSITFPSEAGNVYGGTLTVNKDGTGVLVADEVKDTITDLSTWTGDTSGKRIYKTYSDALAVESTEDFNGMCSIAKASSLNALYNSDTVPAIAISTGKAISIKLPGYTTGQSSSSAIITAVSALLPFELTYTLATPVTYNLTAEQVGKILSLKGVNNLYCDTGKVNSVEWEADTKLYIDRLIASLS